MSMHELEVVTMRVKDITLMALLTAILFVQEQAFTLLPNIQLTVMLLVLYSKVLGLKKTTFIILVHTLLDNLVMGSFNLYFIAFMLAGWLLIPLLLTTVFKKVESTIALAFLGILFSFLYSWVMAPASLIIQDALTLPLLIAYLQIDIWWEILLAMSSFLTILWLYEPLYMMMKNLETKQ